MRLSVLKRQLEDLVRQMGYAENLLELAGDEHAPLFSDFATELSIMKERVKEMVEEMDEPI
jgi:hypothetical protein